MKVSVYDFMNWIYNHILHTNFFANSKSIKHVYNILFRFGTRAFIGKGVVIFSGLMYWSQ